MESLLSGWHWKWDERFEIRDKRIIRLWFHTNIYFKLGFTLQFNKDNFKFENNPNF